MWASDFYFSLLYFYYFFLFFLCHGKIVIDRERNITIRNGEEEKKNENRFPLSACLAKGEIERLSLKIERKVLVYYLVFFIFFFFH